MSMLTAPQMTAPQMTAGQIQAGQAIINALAVYARSPQAFSTSPIHLAAAYVSECVMRAIATHPELGDRMVLRGGRYIASLVGAKAQRVTSDVDVLVEDADELTPGELFSHIREALSGQIGPGLIVDPDSLAIQSDKALAVDGGLGFVIRGYAWLGTQRQPLRVDIGLGDRLPVHAVQTHEPMLPGYGRSFKMRAVTPELVLADKLRLLDRDPQKANLKHLYDASLLLLPHCHHDRLQAAVEASWTNRGMQPPASVAALSIANMAWAIRRHDEWIGNWQTGTGRKHSDQDPTLEQAVTTLLAWLAHTPLSAAADMQPEKATVRVGRRTMRVPV